MNALPSARGAKARARRGCEEQGRLEGTYIEGAQMRGVRAGSGRGLEREGGGFIRVLLQPGVRHGPRQ